MRRALGSTVRRALRILPLIALFSCQRTHEAPAPTEPEGARATPLTAPPTAQPTVVQPPATPPRSATDAADRAARIAELVDRMRPHLARSDEGLEVERRPDGGRRVELRGRFAHATVARMRPDGSFEHVCVDSPEALAAALEPAR